MLHRDFTWLHARRLTTSDPVNPPAPPEAYYIAAGASGSGANAGDPMSRASFELNTLNPGDDIFLNRDDIIE